jgi:hypothetical protein
MLPKKKEKKKKKLICIHIMGPVLIYTLSPAEISIPIMNPEIHPEFHVSSLYVSLMWKQPPQRICLLIYFY